MNKILRSMAVLTLAFAGLVGCDYESRAVGDANPARVAEMKQALSRSLAGAHLLGPARRIEHRDKRSR